MTSCHLLVFILFLSWWICVSLYTCSITTVLNCSSLSVVILCLFVTAPLWNWSYSTCTGTACTKGKWAHIDYHLYDMTSQIFLFPPSLLSLAIINPVKKNEISYFSFSSLSDNDCQRQSFPFCGITEELQQKWCLSLTVWVCEIRLHPAVKSFIISL